MRLRDSESLYLKAWEEFQSTLPRRERPIGGPCAALREYFNPRSRVGSDSAPVIGYCISSSFQSTLPRRERPEEPATLWELSEFQSTLPRKERPAGHIYHLIFDNNFNPRSRVGSDGCPYRRATLSYGFQSTLPRRERHPQKIFCCIQCNFNPRSRVGSDTIAANMSLFEKISIHAPA